MARKNPALPYGEKPIKLSMPSLVNTMYQLIVFKTEPNIEKRQSRDWSKNQT